MRLVPKNWDSFQHYKDRSPPWIKLHKSLIDDRAYQCLPLASRALAPMLWLLASEEKDGAFNAAPEELAFRLRTSEKEILQGLDPLIKAGFFMPVQSDSDVLAPCLQPAVPETEKRRDREEGFDSFWQAYPNKKAKADALKAWGKVPPELHSSILAAVTVQKQSADWLKDGGKFIPHAATWLNGKRWEDETATEGSIDRIGSFV